MIYGGYFDIDNKQSAIDKLEKETSKHDFWNDNVRSNKIIEELNSLKDVVGKITNLKSRIDALKDLSTTLDEESIPIVEEEVLQIDKDTKEASLLLLLNGKYDKENAILEVHSGAGGTEACDWAMMLYRMYTRWCDKNGYKYTVLDYQEGEEVGIKSVSMLVKGLYAYGYLKCESGIHRLVRLSPFDANHKRHTSFASVMAVPFIDDKTSVDINEKDLRIDVYRSSGCGGQGVNTTDSAVRITHIPTNIVVTCQNERSQIQNKEQAMKILKSKLLLLETEKKNSELNSFKENQQNIEFGSQIRSYVMHPYSLVKDHRTLYETSNVSKVLDGDINIFIEMMLKEDKNDKE